MADYLPSRPSQFWSVNIHTFADAVDRVLEAFDIDASNRHMRRAVRSCMDAYREIPNYHEWSYLQRQGQLVTETSQSVTCSYDHTGGASERLVTLTSGTFPTNASWFWLKIGNASYRISSRLSSTTAQLDVSLNPGTDVSSTGATLVRYEYPLPIDFRAGQRLVSVSRDWFPQYVSHDAFLRRYGGSNNPSIYTITASGNRFGIPVVEFDSGHESAVTYEFRYKARPRPIALFDQSPEYTTGTVSTSGTTVTGSGTAWTSRMIGCVIRVSSSADSPSGQVGSERVYNPFAEQRIVTAVASSTSLTIDSDFESSYTDVGHSIGDPLDVEEIMLDPLYRYAEWQYSMQSGDVGDKSKQSQISEKYAAFTFALKLAMAGDNRNRDYNIGSSGEYRQWHPVLLDQLRAMS